MSQILRFFVFSARPTYQAPAKVVKCIPKLTARSRPLAKIPSSASCIAADCLKMQLRQRSRHEAPQIRRLAGTVPQNNLAACCIFDQSATCCRGCREDMVQAAVGFLLGSSILPSPYRLVSESQPRSLHAFPALSSS